MRDSLPEARSQDQGSRIENQETRDEKRIAGDGRPEEKGGVSNNY